MKNAIATLGIAHSGTNLLKRLFIDLFSNNKYPYVYRYLGHNKSKDGKLFLDVQALNVPNLYIAVFNYRNEFDRRFSYFARSITGGLKGWPPTTTDVDINNHREAISQKAIELLTNAEEMKLTRDRCDEVLNAKKLFVLKCKELNVNCLCLAYEEFYENFDHIFESLSKYGVIIDDEDKQRTKKEYSVEKVFKVSRDGPDAKDIHQRHNLLSNHVSHTRGEPYFWTKFMNFNEVFDSLPKENQEYFKEIVRNHPHKNIPKL